MMSDLHSFTFDVFVTGLRVIDASAMPSSVTGNPQGAIMMVAERGASAILRDYGQ